MTSKCKVDSNVGTSSVAPPGNGSGDSLSLLNPENTIQESILQPLLQGIDDHFFEFSEVLRTVGEALSKVVKGKLSAQAEALEWKHKYEQERVHNLHLKKNVPTEACCSESGGKKESELVGQKTVSRELAVQSDQCYGKRGICSHEVLQDGEPDSNPTVGKNKMMTKALSKFPRWRMGDSTDQNKHNIVSFERGSITTAEGSNKQYSLHWNSPPKTVLIFTKPNSASARIICLEMVRWLREQERLNIFVEPRVVSELLMESSYYNFVETWQDEKEIVLLSTKVDLIVTLGGDGTVLWAASKFKEIPPIVPFSLGSLGFMTPFHGEDFKERISQILRGPMNITLRHRLECHVIRKNANAECDNEGPFLVLNEVTIDRGISSFLTNLECYCDNTFITCVQGDGLILSTTSGSTAYSLAAGGSMVHPKVPAILFTPICPHSLSFRPLILPEHVKIRIQVAVNGRGEAWASFDGKDRKKLGPGDTLLCSMARWPVPTACQVDSTIDFLRGMNHGLHWNLRKTQSLDGPRDS